MDAYLSWKYLHILMFVFWVGTDMGVFISCKKSTDPKVPIDARFMLLHMALRIELLPRAMWKAALPLGVMLSHELGSATAQRGWSGRRLDVQPCLARAQSVFGLALRQTHRPPPDQVQQHRDQRRRRYANCAGSHVLRGQRAVCGGRDVAALEGGPVRPDQSDDRGHAVCV